MFIACSYLQFLVHFLFDYFVAFYFCVSNKCPEFICLTGFIVSLKCTSNPYEAVCTNRMVGN